MTFTAAQIITTEQNKAQSLYRLHERLKQIEKTEDVDASEIEFIQRKIRELLPKVDTGKVLPQKKTPSGRTQRLQMNYKQKQVDKQDPTEIEHFRFFAQIANHLGLQLEILTDGHSRADITKELETEIYKQLNYHITESHKPVSKWAEDGVEYLENGKIAVLNSFNDELLAWAMTEGRRQRWRGKLAPENLEEALRDDHLWIPLGVRVNADKTGIEQALAAQAKGQEVGYIRAYIEGGNMITGEDATGKSVIIIGKDSIDTTAHLYQIKPDEVRKILCEDFGLGSIDQIICVEQPGQFHLDMGLLCIGNGVVIVNDSQTELKDAIEMAEMVPCMTTKTMAAQLTLQSTLEEAAVIDLKQAGIKVLRKKLGENTLYNFFNGEFVTGKDGFNYYITNGGPPEKMEQFENLMTNEWGVVKQVFFSPQNTAQKSLQERGGIGCRIKGAPVSNNAQKRDSAVSQ